jgi:hypothetical protein
MCGLVFAIRAPAWGDGFGYSGAALGGIGLLVCGYSGHIQAIEFLASFDRCTENISVAPIVIPELELRDIQRQIFMADLVKTAHNAAFDE